MHRNGDRLTGHVQLVILIFVFRFKTLCALMNRAQANSQCASKQDEQSRGLIGENSATTVCGALLVPSAKTGDD
jgi:hypothetical protein